MTTTSEIIIVSTLCVLAIVITAYFLSERAMKKDIELVINGLNKDEKPIDQTQHSEISSSLASINAEVKAKTNHIPEPETFDPKVAAAKNLKDLKISLIEGKDKLYLVNGNNSKIYIQTDHWTHEELFAMSVFLKYFPETIK